MTRHKDSCLQNPAVQPEAAKIADTVSTESKSRNLIAPLYSEPPDPNIFWVLDCTGCQTEDDHTTGSPEPDGIVLCDGCKRWSHIACEKVQFGLPENFDNADVRWICASCHQNVPLWTDAL